MENSLNHIHIFRTNLGDENLQDIAKMFGDVPILQWSVDLEDCDKVLRVVSQELTQEDIISLVCWHGFECADLT